MKDLMVTNLASDLTQNDVRDILQECLNSTTSESRIYESLMTLVRSFKESLAAYEPEYECERELLSSIENAKYISNVLKKCSQRTESLRYYYFGMYHAKIEQIQEDILARQVSIKQQEVASRKHFSSIMQILYSQQMVQQSELAKLLSIDRANLSREMDRLCLAGFVEERKAGKFKLYNLSAQGHVFYNRYLSTQSQLQQTQRLDLPVINTIQVYRNDRQIQYHESLTKSYLHLYDESPSYAYWKASPQLSDSIDYVFIDSEKKGLELDEYDYKN